MQQAVIKFETVKKLAKYSIPSKDLASLDQLQSSSPPSVFVGSKLKYPEVNVGILSPVKQQYDNSWVYDAPAYWADHSLGIQDILNLRAQMVNARFRSQVSDARGKKNMLNIAKEIALAARPVDLEMQFKHKLQSHHGSDRVVTPHGIQGQLEQARITSNVSIPQRVESVVNDNLKAADALIDLYDHHVDSYALSKILSIGVLGLKKNKKLVPTRWSITTTDDTLGKHLLEGIRDYPVINDFQLFTGSFLGNEYLVCLLPNVFSYELFELYLPGSSWNSTSTMKASTDYENYHGRKNYATSTQGGYYAARLPILEYLHSIKKQASVLVFRLELASYWAALGVWVVRESVRKAIHNKPENFSSLNSLLSHVKKTSYDQFHFDCSELLGKSKLLGTVKNQTNLRRFF